MQHSTQGLLSTILDPQEAIFTTMLLIPGQNALPQLFGVAHPCQLMSGAAFIFNPI